MKPISSSVEIPVNVYMSANIATLYQTVRMEQMSNLVVSRMIVINLHSNGFIHLNFKTVPGYLVKKN